MPEYRKYVYWLTPQEEAALQRREGPDFWAARNVVCTLLHRAKRIGSAGPGVWDRLCRRQGSWYRRSSKNGQYLVVSAEPLTEYQHRLETVLTLSDFSLPQPATVAGKKRLIESQLFLGLLPPGWNRPTAREKEHAVAWAQRLEPSVASFARLFLTATANHANFISPMFFTRVKGRPVPYSIDRSAHLCSCCVELFGLMEMAPSCVLVAPCPGAVRFARLEPDQYLRAQRGDGPVHGTGIAN